MYSRTLRTSLTALVIIAGLGAATAVAQPIDPEGGDVWVPPPDDPPPPPQREQQPWYQGGPTGQEPAQRQQPAQGSTAQPADDGRDNHERVVGHIAFGWMGITTVPIGSPSGPGLSVDTVSAPAIGVRYWITDLAGIDVGLGLGYIGGNIDSGIDSFPVDNAFAMVIHGGVPLALFHEGHFTLLVVPELNFAFSTGTAYGPISDADRGRSGLLFQLGGRLGTEIHFGFMGIPQLSLQASVGIYFEYQSASVGGNRAGSVDPVGVNAYLFGTTVMGEPWDIFLGSLSALYYF